MQPSVGDVEHEAAPEVLLAAYKQEAKQLRDALHIAVKEHGTAFNDAMEGKYLAQVKKNRTLSVQLDTAQSQLRATQSALKLEEEKVSRLTGAALLSTTSATAAAGGAATRQQRRTRTRSSAAPSIISAAVPADDAAKVDRLYQQLHAKELQYAEVKRMNRSLRLLVQQEVGLHREGDIDQLLAARHRSSKGDGDDDAGKGAAPADGNEDGDEADGVVSAEPTGDGVSRDDPPAAAASLTFKAQQGWRGRAQEIIVLRGKLKDAKRELEVVRQRQRNGSEADGPFDENENESHDDGGSSGIAGGGGGSNLDDISSGAAPTKRRDVDDAARSHLEVIQQRRMQKQQQLEYRLEEQAALYAEEKEKSKAQQAKWTILHREYTQLKNYVEQILEKSSSDDALIEAYKEEMEHLRKAALHLQRDAATAAASQHTSGVPVSASAEREVVQQLRHQIASLQHQLNSRPTPSPPPQVAAAEPLSGEVAGIPPSQAILWNWLRTAVVTTASPLPESGDKASARLPQLSAVMGVLQAALRHVLELEQLQKQLSNDERTKLYHSIGASAASPSIDMLLLQENQSLKRRVASLTDVIDRQLYLQQVFQQSSSASSPFSSASP